MYVKKIKSFQINKNKKIILKNSNSLKNNQNRSYADIQ